MDIGIILLFLACAASYLAGFGMGWIIGFNRAKSIWGGES